MSIKRFNRTRTSGGFSACYVGSQNEGLWWLAPLVRAGLPWALAVSTPARNEPHANLRAQREGGHSRP